MSSTHPHTPLPLYDTSVPLACTITAGEVPGRIDLIEKLRLNVLKVERSPHGLVLHLADTPDVLADAERFTVDEKRCCEFWGFAIQRENGLALRWDGPPGTEPFIDRLLAYFENRAPLGSLVGIL
jgi:hypothetical protein